MAKTVVNYSDQMAQFVSKTNTISTHLGDTTQLTTTQDSDLVGAINEIELNFNNLDSDVGNRASLTTDDKSSLVLAINEIKASAVATDSSLSGFLRSDQLDTKTAGDLVFSDNVKAAFGDSSDLQIYHDGLNSYIAEGGSGTGSLKIKANNLLAYNNSDVPYFQGITGGTFRIYHNGSTKLATTATGVDITGGLNTTGNVGIGTTSTVANSKLNVVQGIVASNDSAINPYFQTYNDDAGTDLKTWRFGGQDDGKFLVQTVNDAYSAATTRMSIDNSGVDITGILKAPDAYSTTIVSAPNVHIAADGSFARSTFSALGSRVLLSSVTVSTAVTTVDFDNTLITDTYNDYEVDIQNLMATTRAPFSVRVGFANTPSNSAIYNFYFENRLRHQTATTTVAVNSVNHADAQFVPWNATYQLQNSNSDHPQYGTWKFSNVRTSNSWMLMQAEMHGTTAHPNNLYVGWSYGSGAFKSASPVNYLSFIVGGSTNIRAGTFNLYGIQK